MCDKTTKQTHYWWFIKGPLLLRTWWKEALSVDDVCLYVCLSVSLSPVTLLTRENYQTNQREKYNGRLLVQSDVITNPRWRTATFYEIFMAAQLSQNDPFLVKFVILNQMVTMIKRFDQNSIF